MTENILEIKDLQKAYGDHQVLKGVNLSLEKGDVVSIIGSSGSGKTTLLRCVNLLEEFQNGTIKISGQEIGYTSANGKRARLKNSEITKNRSLTGMVFQSFNLFPHLTATENITLALRKVQSKSKSEALDKIGRAHV